MTLSETKTYLSGLTLAQALWWFTENIGEGHKHRSALFFFLRARMVTYSAKEPETLNTRPQLIARLPQPLTDAQIDALDTFALHWLTPRQRKSVRELARAIEAAHGITAAQKDQKLIADRC